MELNEYQAKALTTAIYPGKQKALGLLYVGLKLAGEAGEVSENIGKALRDDSFGEANVLTPARHNALAKELGDVLWYVAAAAQELGLDLETIARLNVQKLAHRRASGTLHGSGDDR